MDQNNNSHDWESNHLSCWDLDTKSLTLSCIQLALALKDDWFLENLPVIHTDFFRTSTIEDFKSSSFLSLPSRSSAVSSQVF